MPLANYAFYTGAILFVVADALQKTTSKGVLTWRYLSKRSVYTSIVSIAATFIIYGFHTFPTISIALQIALCSFCCGLGLLFYIKAVNSLKFSNVGSLAIIGNVINHLSGLVLFHEKLQKLDLLCFGLMSFGCVFQLIYSPNLRGAKYVIFSSFFWTMGYVLLSYVLKQTPNVYWSVPIMEVSILVMSIFVSYFFFKNEILPDEEILSSVKGRLILLLIALFIYFASLLNNYSFQQLPLTTINFFQLSLMPIGYILSLKIFKEQPTKVELISFLTGFAGFALFIFTHK